MSLQGVLRTLRPAFVFAVTFLAIAAAASAAPPRWVRATPFGVPMAALAQAPSAPQILYAVSQEGRVFRSLDGGATWHRRKGDVVDQVLDLFVDPRDVQTVYASTNGARLYRTRDGGLTWSRIGPELVGLYYGFAVDTIHPGILFVSTWNGLYRSDDGGDSWTPTTAENQSISGVAIDPRTDAVFAMVNAGSAESAVWKSTDHGATWTSASAVLYGPPGLPRFVFDLARPETLYLFFTGAFPAWSMLRSTDGGASWSELTLETGILDLAALPDGVLFAATDYNLERSVDGGLTWVSGEVPLDAFTRLLVSSAPGEVFAAGNSGLWKSGNFGASWVDSNHGILAQGASAVAVAPTGPPAVVALGGTSLFRSEDQGATWARFKSPFYEPQPYAIEAFDARNPGTIYGIANGQAAYPAVSTNGGRQWSRLHLPFNCDYSDSICEVHLTKLALDPLDGSLFVAGWYYFHYVGGGNFLLRSEDGGQTWKKLARVAQLGGLVVDPNQRGTYHAVSCAGLFRSTDEGVSWRKTGRGLPKKLCLNYARLPVLAVDPQDPQRLYVGTLNQGVFASADGGATFRAMNRGLETAAIRTLLIDPADSTRLYAGADPQGVFRWNAEQRKWTPLNQGLPRTGFAGAIALDPRQPSLLYAASPVEGVFRLDLEE